MGGQVASRSSMRGGRGRRSMAEINVVPYIDVMLVLLVIFMVTAPLVTPGVVDLPSIAKSSQAKSAPITIVIRQDHTLEMHDASRDLGKMAQGDIVATIVDLQAKDQNRPVVISADKKVEYDAVMQMMDALQKQRIQRVGLAVKPAP